MTRISITFGLATCLMALTAAANGVGDRVDNFKLLDHRGDSHELHYLSDRKAVVLMSHTGGCEAFAGDIERFEALAAEYAEEDVEFLMINADGLTDRRDIGDEPQTPVLVDDTRIVGESLGFQAAGEVLIVDPANWQVVYRGGERADTALADFLAGRDIADGAGVPGDCSLTFDRPADITYTDDVGPILAANCVTCHREGGIGPWAMTGYDMVRGFAPMIREVIRTKRMPPWHADPVHGDFSNDRSLTTDEIRKIVHWAESGAPRGEGADPLATLDREWPEWAHGEPDVVIDIPAFDVPASGVVEYKYQYVRNPLKQDVWVQATDILPGDRSALHHVIVTWSIPGRDENGKRRGGGLGGYVPGMVAFNFPDNTGIHLPAGSFIVFQMHYTPYGKAVTDNSRLGLYLHDKPPEHRLRTAVLANTKIRIPPHSKNHAEVAERTFDRDILLYNLLPHAHYRGKASEFRAFYPDGTEEVLLSVPNYDFNWQTTYLLTDPKRIPAGTRVVHRTWWDNSEQNPANPDPTREVPWGLQSWDEMLYGAMDYRVLADDTVEVASAGSD
ncbi:MAG: redoxin domain-containing protein [Gammaproteobacteria bacterium]|nr:redoxin domain-containing protein [Gammaproteobacteria bacterium]